MARGYELVSSVYDRGEFTNEKIVYIGSLTEIDKITTMYHDSKSMMLESNDFDLTGSNVLSIRYPVSASNKLFYMNVLFDQKEMKKIIDGVHLASIYIGGKKVFTEVVDVNDPFFKEMRLDFYRKIDSMGYRFLDEVMTVGGSNSLKLLVKRYLDMSSGNIYSLEDLENFNVVKADLNKEFTRYINFRNYVVSLKKYNSRNSLAFSSLSSKRGLSIGKEAVKLSNPVISKNSPYSKVAEYLGGDDDKEEFLEIDEIEKSVGEGNDIKGYKGYVKK